MGDIISLEDWKNGKYSNNNKKVLNIDEFIEEIERKISAEELPVSLIIKRKLWDRSVYEVKIADEVYRRYTMSPIRSTYLDYAIFVFEEQIRELIEENQDRLFFLDKNMFYENRREKRMMILRDIRKILAYLYETSREQKTECIFEAANTQKLDEKLKVPFGEKLRGWQEFYVEILTNYSTLSGLQQGDMETFNKLIMKRER
jgi:hypothetical protein